MSNFIPRNNTSRQKKMLKLHLWMRQKGTCPYCNELMSPYSATFDHVVPISRGGTQGPRNVVLSCALCNWDKGDKTTREYLGVSPDTILKQVQ